MLASDDPRHGTNSGYNAGCREVCCRTAHADYRRHLKTRHYLNGGKLKVSTIGVKRRIEALMTLGYSTIYLDRELGQCDRYVINLLERDMCQPETHRRVAELYDRLSMTEPVAVTAAQRQTISRIKNHAARRRYAPPLAWDDIDDPHEKPKHRVTTKSYEAYHATVDHVVVERLLLGERVKANNAERKEAMRRWLADGRSEKSLNDLHGWKDGRYIPRAS